MEALHPVVARDIIIVAELQYGMLCQGVGMQLLSCAKQQLLEV